MTDTKWHTLDEYPPEGATLLIKRTFGNGNECSVTSSALLKRIRDFDDKIRWCLLAMPHGETVTYTQNQI